MGRKMTDKKTHDPIYSCKLKGFKDKTKPSKQIGELDLCGNIKTRMKKVSKNEVQS